MSRAGEAANFRARQMRTRHRHAGPTARVEVALQTGAILDLKRFGLTDALEVLLAQPSAR